MRRLFLYAFLAGLVVVAMAITFWPLPAHVRYLSDISVQPDGGRLEKFVIRWPEDRISRPDEVRSDLPPGAVVGAVVLEDAAGNRATAEIFRLRDAADNVIGIASRLAGTGGAVADPRSSASNWLLVIPSRGSLMLAQTDAIDATVTQKQLEQGPVAFAPAQAAAFWSDRSRLRVTAANPRNSGRVLQGTNEFSGLTGSFTETWELEEVNADGNTRGQIVLSTLTAAVE